MATSVQPIGFGCGAVVAIMAAVLPVAPAGADWPASGLALASGLTRQASPFGLTGAGGELHAFWVDAALSPYALFAQHLTIDGVPASGWSENGRGVVVSPAFISRPIVVSDGTGGALLAWFDLRSSGGSLGVYAIRVDADATVAPGWTLSGTPIGTATNAQGLGPLNDLLAVCSDGAGGAFVAWTDARNTPPAGVLVYDVFAQHVLADGSLDANWPAGGRGLTTGPGYKYPHALVEDATGGFWLVTENSNATYQIAATHHDRDGAELGRWTTPSFASRPTAVSDGAGGIYLAWGDCRDCPAPTDAIDAIRLGGAALPHAGWPSDGVVIGASPGDDDLPVIVTTENAAMIAWLVPAATDQYVARRVEASGSFLPSWQSGFRAFARSEDILAGWPLIAPDGAGGAMFAFRRNRPNLFGSRVTKTAQVPATFPDTGLSLCTESGEQFPVSLVSDGLNGAYLLWEDRRHPENDVDVYVIRFTRDGEVGSTTSVVPSPGPANLALSAPRPNPATESSSFDVWLASSTQVRVEVLDLAGRVVTVLHGGNLPAGASALAWDGRNGERHPVAAGMYLVSAVTTGARAVRRIIRVH